MNHGWGKHLWDVSLADLIQFNKASSVTFVSSYATSRLAPR